MDTVQQSNRVSDAWVSADEYRKSQALPLLVEIAEFANFDRIVNEQYNKNNLDPGPRVNGGPFHNKRYKRAIVGSNPKRYNLVFHILLHTLGLVSFLPGEPKIADTAVADFAKLPDGRSPMLSTFLEKLRMVRRRKEVWRCLEKGGLPLSYCYVTDLIAISEKIGKSKWTITPLAPNPPNWIISLVGSLADKYIRQRSKEPKKRPSYVPPVAWINARDLVIQKLEEIENDPASAAFFSNEKDGFKMLMAGWDKFCSEKYHG